METRLGNYIHEYSVRNKLDEDIPVYSVTNSQGFCKDYFGKEVASKNKTSYKIVPKGYFAYNPSRINVGSVDWQRNEERVIVSPLYNVFYVDSEINHQYLFYFLKSNFVLQNIKAVATGSVRDNLKFEMLKEFQIKLLPLEEQNEIVEKLDLITKIIEEYKAELYKYDELIKARFIEMFGDPIRNPYGWYNDCLNNVCTKINDGTHCSPESFDKGDYMYITAKNIKQNGLDLSNVTYVSEKVHKPIYQRCNPEFGDILYIKDGATTGIATINTMKNEFTLLSSVALLKYDRSLINGYYLIHLLNSKEMYSKIRKNMGGAAITRLTIAKIKEIKVIVPPIDLQNQFAEFVGHVDKSRFDIKKSIIELEREVVYD